MNRMPPGADRAEQGSALIVTLMVIAVTTALSTSTAALTIGNLRSAWRAQQSGAALSAADAGAAQAVSYLRAHGVRALACSPTCADNPWGNQASPVTVPIGGAEGQSYQVWIEPIAPYPANDPARYRIHATGTAAGGARRPITADVHFTLTDMARGIYGRAVNAGGDVTVHRQSIFTTGCVYRRSKLSFDGIDAAYGIPAAVHSSQIITDAQGSGQFCPTTSKPVHRTGPGNATPLPCSPEFPHDQDRLGASLLGTGCASTQASYPAYQPADLDGDGGLDVDGSFLRDDAALFARFGLRSPALSTAQLDQLRSTAREQRNYWTSTSGWSSPDESGAVMYFDLTATDPGGTVDLNDVTGFDRLPGLAADDPACRTASLVIVVEGGNVRLNGNRRLAASVFLVSGAPYGQVAKANGGSTFIGTLYADTIDLTGTADLWLDECFLHNISPALFDIDLRAYRELDR
jgi:hypothetical protein